MTSPIDGKITPFGEAVDTLEEFVKGSGYLQTPQGPLPTLRQLAADVTVAASDKVNSEIGDLQGAVGAARDLEQSAREAEQGAVDGYNAAAALVRMVSSWEEGLANSDAIEGPEAYFSLRRGGTDQDGRIVQRTMLCKRTSVDSAVVFGSVVDGAEVDDLRHHAEPNATFAGGRMARRRPTPYPFYVRDRNGRTPLFTRMDGVTWMYGAQLPESLAGWRRPYMGGRPLFSVFGPDGQTRRLMTVSPTVDRVDLNASLRAAAVEVKAGGAKHRHPYQLHVIIKRSDEKALLWEQRTGLDFIPSEELKERLTPDELPWRGAAPSIGALWAKAGLVVTAVQDSDRCVYTVSQRRDGDLDTYVIRTMAPLEFYSFQGQSNSGAPAVYPDGDSLAITPPFPGNVLTFSGAGIAATGFDVQPESDLVDLAPAGQLDAPNNHYLATLSAIALEGLRRRKSPRPSPGILSHTCWSGGRPLSHFDNPSGIWAANALQARRRARAVAAAYGRTIVEKNMAWVQGEGGEYGRAAHLAQLSGFWDWFRPEARDAIGQDFLAKVWMLQTNVGDYPDAEPQTTNMESTALAHWDLARTRAADGFRLAGPMYQFPLKPFVDNIHTVLTGRGMAGETLASAIHKEETTGTPWVPLWPLSAERSGTAVHVEFAVPAGNLAWDTDWIRPMANKGFAFIDDANSADVIAAAISGPTSVELTLSGIPTGSNPRVQYAVGKARDAEYDRWATGRGQLFSPTEEPSYLRTLGFDIPEFIRHYSIKFDQEITT